MKNIAAGLVILLTITLAWTTQARATATYDGTLTGSISVAGCLSGAILHSCVQSGLVIFGTADSSPPFAGGAGVATQTVTAFGAGTDTVMNGTTFRTGMDGGSGFTITSLISGSAAATGSSATSLTFPSPTIFVRNTDSGEVTLVVDYSFSYINTIGVNLPLTETAFSFSEFDLNRIDSVFGFPDAFQDLFESSCSNINPPQFGLTSDPCADSGSGRLSLTIAGCVGFACEVTVTALSLDAGQIGLAAVVPEPGSLALLSLGLAPIGVLSRLRWRRSVSTRI
jgi:hypothetical protein